MKMSNMNLVQHVQDFETTPKDVASNFKIWLLKDCSETFIVTKINYWCKSATCSESKHHNTVKFLVSVFCNSIITWSKVYTRRTEDKAVNLQSCFRYLT